MNTYLGRTACLCWSMSWALGCSGDGQSNNMNSSLGGQQSVAGAGTTARSEASLGGVAGALTEAITAAGGGTLSKTSTDAPAQAGAAGAATMFAAAGSGGSTANPSTAGDVNLAGSNSAGTRSSLPAAGGANGGTINGAGGSIATGGTTELPNAAGGTAGAGGRVDDAGGTTGTDASTGGTTTGTSGGTAGTGDTGAGGTPRVTECFPALLRKPNVVVLRDASPTGADVGGPLWVGGNATFSGYGVGMTLPTGKCEDFSLIVGGTLSGQVNANAGKVAVGATSAASVSFSVSPPCPITRGSLSSDFEAIAHDVKALSTALQLLPQEGSVQTGGGLTLTGGSETLNVFNVSASQLTSVGNFVVKVPLASTVLVNVSGAAANWTGVGFHLPDGASCRGGTSDFCSHVLFNFYEATSLALSGIGVQGSILAPYASLSGAGGNVDGQVFVDTLKGGIEYHPYLFSGCFGL